MRCSELVIPAALSLALAAPASAGSCFVCDEVVELDPIRAACYMLHYDRYLSDILGASQNHAEVDLSPCTGQVVNRQRGIEAFPKFPGIDNLAPDGFQPGLRQVYILDEPGARCLRDRLAGLTEPISPTIRIDLTRECAP